MGYFSSGTEGEIYEAQYCARCIHGNAACSVWLLHLRHNYKECNKPDSMLHTLIPRPEDKLGNEKCTMFHATDAARKQAQIVELSPADQAYLEGKKRA